MKKQNESSDSNSPSWGQAALKLVEILATHDTKSAAASSVQSSTDVLVRFAADRSFTVNTARRHLAAVSFLRSIMEPVAFLSAISDENCPPFNDIEYLKKIHAIDPATAKAHLDEVLSRKISRAKLAAIYDHIQQGRPNQQAIRKGQKNDLHSQVFEALQSPTRTIFPTGIFKKMPHKLVDFDFPLPHAVVKIDEESDQEVRVHAVEIRVPNIWGKHERWQLLERTQLLSTFFDAIWIFIPAPRTVEHQHFTEALIRSIRVLRLTSVGLVTCAVASEVKLEVVLQPSGPPVIDRRYLFPIDGVNGAQGNRNVPALPRPSTTSN